MEKRLRVLKPASLFSGFTNIRDLDIRRKRFYDPGKTDMVDGGN